MAMKVVLGQCCKWTGLCAHRRNHHTKLLETEQTLYRVLVLAGKLGIVHANPALEGLGLEVGAIEVAAEMLLELIVRHALSLREEAELGVDVLGAEVVARHVPRPRRVCLCVCVCVCVCV